MTTRSPGDVWLNLPPERQDEGITLPPEAVAALGSIWRHRIAAADATELRALGPWFASGRFAPDGALDLLAQTLSTTAGRIDDEREVAARLHALEPDRLPTVLTLFERILSGLEHGHTSVRLVADGQELVRLGLTHADPQTRQRAERIRDRFGALGHAAFETVA